MEAYDSMAEQEIEEAYGGFEDEILESLLQIIEKRQLN